MTNINIREMKARIVVFGVGGAGGNVGDLHTPLSYACVNSL